MEKGEESVLGRIRMPWTDISIPAPGWAGSQNSGRPSLLHPVRPGSARPGWAGISQTRLVRAAPHPGGPAVLYLGWAGYPDRIGRSPVPRPNQDHAGSILPIGSQLPVTLSGTDALLEGVQVCSTGSCTRSRISRCQHPGSHQARPSSSTTPATKSSSTSSEPGCLRNKYLILPPPGDKIKGQGQTHMAPVCA